MTIRVFVLLFLLSSNVSYASLFGDNEARQQIDALRKQVSDMEARIAKMEQTLGSQGLLDLYSKVETLEQELGKLNGQIEMLTNENSMLQKRQRDFYIDLDNRLRHIEQPGSKQRSSLPAENSANVSGHSAAAAVAPQDDAVVAEAGAAPESAVSTAEPESDAVAANNVYIAAGSGEADVYKEAYDLFKNGEYASSIAHFEAFLQNFPQSNLAPAAAYWIGNARYAMRDYQLAVEAQKQLIGKYPDSNKVPDAYLNMASSLYEMGDSKTSKTTLENLLAKYPNSDAAKKAKQRLVNLK
jgi:tol-pal system protein YbgF